KGGDDKVPVTLSEENPAKLVDPKTGEPTDEKTVPALDETGKEIGTYTIDPTTGKVTFQPNPDFVGTPQPAKVQAKDTNGTVAETTYTPTVTPVEPIGTPKETTGFQGQPQTGKVDFTPGNDNVPMDDEVPATFEDGTTEKVVPGEGTYTVAKDGTVTFTPEKDFVGTAKGVTVKRVDKNGTEATAKYTPVVLEVTPTSEASSTTDIQGAVQKSPIVFDKDSATNTVNFKEGNPAVPVKQDSVTLLGTDGQPTKSVTVEGEGTYTIEDGNVVFTPEKDFTGVATPVTIQATDENGKNITTTYTPTVTPVKPVGTPKETTGLQGQPQEGTPTFTPGNDNVPMDDTVPATFEDGTTEKVVPGEGTYTVSPDGKVTFTPEPGFVGEAKGVTVKRVDKNGTEATAKYTPTVLPVTPIGTPAETEGPQGQPQEGTPTFIPGNPNVPMDDTVPATFEDGTTEKVVPGEGTYTVSPDGKVTFTPEPGFVGEAKGVTVKRVDKNGTEATAKYTPTVTPVTPTGTPAETEGPQGQPQEGTPTFTPGNENVPMDDTVPATFEDGTTEKVVPGEGTYTVSPDGKVTFTPEPGFVGEAKGVTVKRVDKNGTEATAKYTPTVTPVTPTGT
ncbi:Ig-like domain-containing protein, partial [Streptococcus fryi]